MLRVKALLSMPNSNYDQLFKIGSQLDHLFLSRPKGDGKFQATNVNLKSFETLGALNLKMLLADKVIKIGVDEVT